MAARARRSGDLRGRLRDLQPEEHQQDARGVARAPTRRCAARRRPRGVRVRGYLSTAFGCPFEGRVDPARRRGHGAPAARYGRVRGGGQRHHRRGPPGAGARASSRRCSKRVPLEQLALHFHDTRGTALANVLAALSAGRAHLRRVGGRAGRVSLCAGRDRQSRDRGSGLHARTASASRPASRCRRCSRRRASSSRRSGTRCHRATTAPQWRTGSTGRTSLSNRQPS